MRGDWPAASKVVTGESIGGGGGGDGGSGGNGGGSGDTGVGRPIRGPTRGSIQTAERGATFRRVCALSGRLRPKLFRWRIRWRTREIVCGLREELKGGEKVDNVGLGRGGALGCRAVTRASRATN